MALCETHHHCTARCRAGYGWLKESSCWSSSSRFITSSGTAAHRMIASVFVSSIQRQCVQTPCCDPLDVILTLLLLHSRRAAALTTCGLFAFLLAMVPFQYLLA